MSLGRDPTDEELCANPAYRDLALEYAELRKVKEAAEKKKDGRTLANREWVEMLNDLGFDIKARMVELELGKVARAMTDILDRGDPGFQLRGTLAGLIGARPDRERIRAVLELARSVVAQRLNGGLADPRPIIDTHSELVRLTGEQPTYNFDAGLLAMEIGTLLARAAGASERANG